MNHRLTKTYPSPFRAPASASLFEDPVALGQIWFGARLAMIALTALALGRLGWLVGTLPAWTGATLSTLADLVSLSILAGAAWVWYSRRARL